MLDAGCWMLDARYWMLDSRYWPLAAGFWLVVACLTKGYAVQCFKLIGSIKHVFFQSEIHNPKSEIERLAA